MNCIEFPKCSPPPGTYHLRSIFDWKSKGFAFGPKAGQLKRLAARRFAVRDKKVPGPGHYSFHAMQKRPILAYSFSKVAAQA